MISRHHWQRWMKITFLISRKRTIIFDATWRISCMYCSVSIINSTIEPKVSLLNNIIVYGLSIDNEAFIPEIYLLIMKQLTKNSNQQSYQLVYYMIDNQQCRGWNYCLYCCSFCPQRSTSCPSLCLSFTTMCLTTRNSCPSSIRPIIKVLNSYPSHVIYYNHTYINIRFMSSLNLILTLLRYIVTLPSCRYQ